MPLKQSADNARTINLVLGLRFSRLSAISACFIFLSAFLISMDARAITLEFNQNSYSVSESDGSANIGVTFSISSQEVLGFLSTSTGSLPQIGETATVTVNFSTVNQSAIAGQDYAGTSQTISFTKTVSQDDINSQNFGFSQVQTVQVPIIDDALEEQDETVGLDLFEPTVEVNGSPLPTSQTDPFLVGFPKMSTLTILANDTPLTPDNVSFDSNQVNVTDDANQTVQISVSRSGDGIGSASVDFSTLDGTATSGSDYQSQSGALQWANGETGAKSISIDVLADTTQEGSEAFSVQLSNPTGNITITTNSFTVNINDGAIQDTIGFDTDQASVSDGATETIEVTLSRSGSGSGPASVQFSTVDGSAVQGEDFQAASGIVEWADGDLSAKTISVTVLADTDQEGDEAFNILLSQPSNAVLGLSSLTVNISDGESTGPVFGILPGLNPNERETATALDSACQSATGDLAQRCSELSDLSEVEKIRAIGEITPGQVSAQTTNSIRIGAVQLRNVGRRQAELRRGGGTMVSTQGATVNVQGQSVPISQLSDAVLGASADETSLGQSERLGFFINGSFSFGDKDTTARERGFNFDTEGVTLGVDYRFTDSLVLGTAMGYAHTDTDYSGTGGDMKTDAGSFSLYGSYYFQHNFYIDWIGSYGYNSFDMNRRIVYTGFETNANGDSDGHQYSGSVSFGKDIFMGDWVINPYARFEYIHAVIDAYTETGGSGLALTIDDQSNQSVNTVLGGQLSKNMSMSWGILTPSVHAEWQHQFKDSSRGISARFAEAAAGTGSFRVVTESPDRDYFNAGASLAATFQQGVSAFLRYEGRFDQSNISNHAFELGMRVPF